MDKYLGTVLKTNTRASSECALKHLQKIGEISITGLSLTLEAAGSKQ